MSADAVGWVFRHSPMRGAAFAVHIAIADSVSDTHGNLFWMASANLATKARVSRETASRAIADLADQGLIEPVDGDAHTRRTAGRPARWRFLFPDLEVTYESRPRGVTRDHTPVTSDHRGCDARSHVTQREPNVNRAARRHRIPDDWEPSDADLAWANQHYPHIDPWAVAREFRTYHQAKGTTFARWDMAYRNRIQQVDQRRSSTGPTRTFL